MNDNGEDENRGNNGKNGDNGNAKSFKNEKHYIFLLSKSIINTRLRSDNKGCKNAHYNG